LGVLHDTGFIDEESGTLGNPTHDEVLLGEKLIVGDAISFRSLVIVVGKKLEADVFLFGPSCLGKWIVTGDAENFAVQIRVCPETGRDVAKFLRANAGEGHGDKKDKDVLLASNFGEGDNFGTTFAESDEGEIRGMFANFDAHIEVKIVEVVGMETEKYEKM
jgi:hypothetical protein